MKRVIPRFIHYIVHSLPEALDVPVAIVYVTLTSSASRIVESAMTSGNASVRPPNVGYVSGKSLMFGSRGASWQQCG